MSVALEPHTSSGHPPQGWQRPPICRTWAAWASAGKPSKAVVCAGLLAGQGASDPPEARAVLEYASPWRGGCLQSILACVEA